MKLKDRIVVIFGATGGIGSVLSRKFHSEGAGVVLVARTQSKLLELAKDLGNERVLVKAKDLSDLYTVDALFKEIENEFGMPDGVIISVGSWQQVSIRSSFSDAFSLAEAHFRNLFLPCFGISFVAQKFLVGQGRGGLIANISSHAAVRLLRGNLTYAPMKAAARSLMLNLREELVGTGVRVTDIQPAIVNTPDNLSFLNERGLDPAEAVQPEDIADWIIKNFDNPEIPAERLFESSVVL